VNRSARSWRGEEGPAAAGAAVAVAAADDDGDDDDMEEEEGQKVLVSSLTEALIAAPEGE
jgi:hypothetical protein